MHRIAHVLFGMLLSAAVLPVHAQTIPALIDVAPTSQPIVTVTASLRTSPRRWMMGYPRSVCEANTEPIRIADSQP